MLSEQDARRLDPEAVIILPAGQQPIKARRIKYFEDRRLAKIYNAQTGPLPHEAIRTADTIAAITSQRIVHTEAALERERARADSLQQALDRVGDRVQFIEDAFNRSVRSLPEAKAEPASEIESDPDSAVGHAASLISEIDEFDGADLTADAVSAPAQSPAKIPG